MDMGRRPELKSAELCDANVTVIEITSIFCLKPLKQVVQLLAARPGIEPHDEDAPLAHTLAHGRTPAAPFSKTQEEHEPPTVTT